MGAPLPKSLVTGQKQHTLLYPFMDRLNNLNQQYKIKREDGSDEYLDDFRGILISIYQ